jgi:hypothetical protein
MAKKTLIETLKEVIYEFFLGETPKATPKRTHTKKKKPTTIKKKAAKKRSKKKSATKKQAKKKQEKKKKPQKKQTKSSTSGLTATPTIGRRKRKKPRPQAIAHLKKLPVSILRMH